MPNDSTPTHVALAVVLQVRDGRLQVLLWERAPRAVLSRVGPPRRLSRRRRDAGGVDPPAPGGEGRRPATHPPRAARDAQRARSATRPSASLRPRTSGSSPSASTRGCPLTPRGIPSTTFPGWRSTTRRSRSPAASGYAPSSRTRTSASPWRRRSSRSRSCARSTQPRSATESRPPTCSASSSAAACSSPRAGGASRDQQAAGPATLYRFRSGELEVTDPFAVLRPPAV